MHATAPCSCLSPARMDSSLPISNNGCDSRQHCGPDSSVRAGLVDERAQAHKHAADVPANGGCTLTAAVVRCSMPLRLVADAAPALASALRRPPLWRAARRVTCGPRQSTSEGAYCGDARCIGCALRGMRMMRTLRLCACGPWETPHAWIISILDCPACSKATLIHVRRLHGAAPSPRTRRSPGSSGPRAPGARTQTSRRAGCGAAGPGTRARCAAARR